MSDSNGPVRRRRIAGESGPAAPAKKAPARKPVAKKAPATAVPAKKTAKKGQADGSKPAVEKSAAKKSSAKKLAAGKAAPEVAVSAPTARKTPATKTPATKPPATKPPATKKPSAAKAPASVQAPSTRAVPMTKPLARPVGRPVVARVPTRSSAGDDNATKPDRTPGSRPSRRDVLWLVPATLVALAALVVGVFMVVSPPGSGDSGSALDTSRRQASSAAASAAETIFSFRYDELDEHLKASKALMTPGFAKEFDKIAPALTELAPQRSIVVQAVARDAAALPCGDDCSSKEADVLVFVDQARLIGGSAEPTVFANRVKVTMVKQDDGWLVSNIRAI